MLKKIMLLGAAIAAFAALAAPFAQAEVTNSEGELAESIVGVSTNTTSTTPNGTLECATVNLSLAYTGGTAHYEGSGSASGTTANHNDPECEIAGTGTKVLITSISATVNLEGNGKGKANFEYTYDITHPVAGTIHCTFVGANVPVSYTPTSSQISINGSMTGGPTPLCATTGTINGTFTASSGGQPVSIH